MTITVDKSKINCLIDTGAETSIIKPGIFPKHLEQILEKPTYFSTINGISKVTNKVITPIPLEFNKSGTLSWKIMDLPNRKYDAIIGQNFLIPLRAKIDLGQKFIETNGRKTYFKTGDSYFLINEIYNFEDCNIQKLDLDHLRRE